MIERKKLIYIYIYGRTMSNLASIFEHALDREITEDDSFESFLETSSSLIKKSVAIETERATTVG